MTLIASDGYEYADIAQRILGNPLENVRNQQIVSYRYHGKPEGFVRAFAEAHDHEKAARPDVSNRQAREHGIIAAFAWLARHNPTP